MIYLLLYCYLVGVFIAYQSLDPRAEHALPKARLLLAILYPVLWTATWIVYLLHRRKYTYQCGYEDRGCGYEDRAPMPSEIDYERQRLLQDEEDTEEWEKNR